jgi:hypothetical protein
MLMNAHDELTDDELALGRTLGRSFTELSLTPAQRQRHLARLAQAAGTRAAASRLHLDGRVREHAAPSAPTRDRTTRLDQPRLRRTLEGAALLLIVLIFAAGALLARALMPGRGSSTANLASAPKVSTVYAVQQTANGANLLPLDPLTLADKPGSPVAAPTANWAVSADGSTMATFDYVQGAAMIIVRDGFTGPVRARFSAPISGLISDIQLNADGSRVLINRQMEPSQWAVIDTTSGKLLMSLDTKSPKLNYDTPMSADRLQLSPDGSRLYRFVFTDRADATGPQPLRISEYDVATGEQIATQADAEIQVGSWQTQGSTEAESVSHYQRPGIAISPDGRQIAIVHPDGKAVTLIDAKDLTVKRTVTLTQQTGFLERALRKLGLAPQSAAAKMLDGVMRSAVYSPDGTTLYTWGDTITTNATDGLQGPGFTRIDLKTGTATQIFQGALIGQVQPSPDGTSLYLTGYVPVMHTSTPQHFVRRLDPASLKTLAERSWPYVFNFELVTQP